MQHDDFHVRHDAEGAAAYVDGTLEPAARAAVMAHLARCAECREFLATLGRGLADTDAAVVGAPRSAYRWLPMAASVLMATAAGGAYVLVRGTHRVPPEPPRVETPAPAPATPAAPAQLPAPSAPARGPASQPVRPQDTTRAGTARHLGGKTFRLVAGEWIDGSYDPLAALPVVTVTTTAEKESALASAPALRHFTGLGSRFTVVLDGTVYRIGVR